MQVWGGRGKSKVGCAAFGVDCLTGRTRAGTGRGREGCKKAEGETESFVFAAGAACGQGEAL